MLTDTIEKDGKNYFVQWDKKNGMIYLTECIPQPSAEELKETLQNMDAEGFEDATMDDVMDAYNAAYDGILETYDFKEVQ